VADYDVRLERIEHKIDDLSEAMISLARAEEKLINIEKNNSTAADRLNSMSMRVDKLHDKVEDNAKTIAIISKLFWIIMTAVVGGTIIQLIQQMPK